jgi:hypothetical protein
MGAIGPQFAFSQDIEQGLGHDAAQAIPRAKNRNRVRFVTHVVLRIVTMDSVGEQHAAVDGACARARSWDSP